MSQLFATYLSLSLFLLSCCVQFAHDLQHNWTLTSLSHAPTICMHNSDYSSQKADGPPRYKPICHWHRSIQTRVRSEETDKGSEAGRRRLIDCRQIHPRVHLCPYTSESNHLQAPCKLEIQLLMLADILFNHIVVLIYRKPPRKACIF